MISPTEENVRDWAEEHGVEVDEEDLDVDGIADDGG